MIRSLVNNEQEGLLKGSVHGVFWGNPRKATEHWFRTRPPAHEWRLITTQLCVTLGVTYTPHTSLKLVSSDVRPQT
jgi:hypothetical protein